MEFLKSTIKKGLHTWCGQIQEKDDEKCNMAYMAKPNYTDQTTCLW
jgi:hypothetical protein